jgi:glyoxylase-like metal-dependent hydrolase (beta-lactamase superfamily II)
MPMCEIITLDLDFMGAAQIIASYAVATRDGGVVLIETGPASTLDTLEQRLADAGWRLRDLRAVCVTHVHLDHAGGAGALAARAGCPVYAHPKGAPHLVDPSKLLASAERLYGDLMEPLWGVTEGAPAEQVQAVDHGQSVLIGEVEIRAWHTPGHAAHHVAWEVGDAIATGDVGGVRFPGASHVLPPMPPPDIDVGQWRSSIDLVRSRRPRRLLLTHFGSFDDPPRHLDELEDRIVRWTEGGKKVAGEGGSAEALAAELLTLDDAELAASDVPEDTIMRYRRLCPMDGNSAGLFRYVTASAGE